MKLRPTIHNVGHFYSSAHTYSSSTPFRQSSALANLARELKSRPLNITYDYLSPTLSHLLNISLRDFLPTSCYPEYFNASKPILPYIAPLSPHTQNSHPLHQGHHLVYFSPPVPHHNLLPDGTDTLHSPPASTRFTRRLWAGGSVAFDKSPASRLYLDGGRAVCVEGIRDVTIKGKAGDEKVFVHIDRCYGYVNPSPDGRARHEDEGISEEDVVNRIWDSGQAAVVERRNLVFLRARGDLRANEVLDERVVKRMHSYILLPKINS